MKQTLYLSLLPLLSILVNACGSAGDSANTASTATDITDVNLTARDASCSAYVGSFESSVTDVGNGVSFMGNFTITATSGECTFASNNIPNHNFNDNVTSFAIDVAEVSKSFSVTTTPTMSSSNTELALDVVNAILLNGVFVDILAPACYGVGTDTLGEETTGCGSDQIDNPWRYDPMSPLNNFGADSHNAHVQTDGGYHYHGNPVALFEQPCDAAEQASPVIGFAADGFPVFGSCIEADDGSLREVTSSYSLKSGVRQDVTGYTTPDSGNGTVNSNNYDGQFRGDYEYTANSGDLDECNGMTVDDQYGYYVTNKFPWILNCYKGTIDSSFSAGAERELNMKSHGH